MKAFLTALKGFAQSVWGLVIVVVVLLWYTPLLDYFNTAPTFDLVLVGNWLALALLAFAVIWAQYKSKVLLSHGILLYIFSSALSIFISSLFSNTPSLAFDGQVIMNLVIMLYALGVVVASLLYDRPKPEKLELLGSLGILVFVAVVYLTSGFNTALLSFLVVLVALLLGSKVVALAYAMYVLISPLFSRVQLILTYFENNLDQQVTVWFAVLLGIVGLVFLTLDFVKALQAKEA